MFQKTQVCLKKNRCRCEVNDGLNKNCCIQVNDDLKYDASNEVDPMQVDKERM